MIRNTVEKKKKKNIKGDINVTHFIDSKYKHLE
jgi:hypothetical protein